MLRVPPPSPAACLGAAVFGLGIWLGAAAAATAQGAAFTPTQRAHWAWKRPVRPAVPRVRAADWVANPIDAFILARLEARGLRPASPAAPLQLIRRVAFDLTGLPPEPEAVESYLRDCEREAAQRPTAATAGSAAYSRMVERYLASPAYGERWARVWLDLARYADTNGYEHDEVRPDMWRYRDYVVRALNSDRPYDRFVLEQLAGDELAPGDPEARVATGFSLLGPDMTDAADQAARRQGTLNDMTDTAGLVFMGLTVGCARCHDHKYEPITQRDYYALQAFFAPARFGKPVPIASAAEQEAFEREIVAWEARRREAQARLDSLAGTARAALREERLQRLQEDVQTAFRLPERARSADQQNLVRLNTRAVEPAPAEVRLRVPENERERFTRLTEALDAVEAARPAAPPQAMALTEDGTNPPATYLLERGELSNRGAEVRPAVPVILGGGAPAITPPTGSAGTGRRLALARWIASPEHPLTARVLVNRVWQTYFGRGIVPTTSDFGLRGESPTHPELLDYLAVAFAKGDLRTPPGPERAATAARPWSLKALHRAILHSSAYRQSSHAAAATLAADPENALFSRMHRKRLEAEALRDAVLAASGRLNRKMRGPGVFPPLPEGLEGVARAWPVTADAGEHRRRSLYIFVRRNLHFPVLEAFDAPDTNQSCARRDVSTTAPQALALFNGAEIREQARYLAGRAGAGAAGPAERAVAAYRLALGRPPAPAELHLAEEFLAAQAARHAGSPPAALPHPEPPIAGLAPAAGAAYVDFCLALFNLNEFLYVD